MADLMTSAAQRLRLDSVQESMADEARLFARRAGDLAELVDLVELEEGISGVEQFLRLELGGTMRLGHHGCMALVEEAVHLRRVLTTTWVAMGEGEVWVTQARSLVRETAGCSRNVAWAVEQRALDRGWLTAPLPPGELTKRLRRTVLAMEALYEPEATAERDEQAKADRYVSYYPQPDGMAAIHAVVPAEVALRHQAALAELVRIEAEADEAAGITRTQAQRTADVLASLPATVLEMLRGQQTPHDQVDGQVDGQTDGQTGGEAQTHKGGVCGHGSATEIVVHLPFATLLGLSTEPAVLDGHGPISAAHALALVPEARLRFAAVCHINGQPLHLEPRTVPAGTDLITARSAASQWYAQYGVAPPDTHEHSTPDQHTAERAADLAALRASQELTERWLSEHTRGDPLTAGPASSASEAATGPLIVVDQHEGRYRPSASLRRFLNVRDPVCTAPGCARPAHLCDQDHERPHGDGGATAAFNLSPKSRHCHRGKTLTWSCRRTPDGHWTWTSPLGRSYTRPPTWDPPPEVEDTALSELKERHAAEQEALHARLPGNTPPPF